MGSLFDGIGGFVWAASLYGIKTLWASEISKPAISVTRRHFPDMEHVGDILQLRGDTLPPVDIITFGSPCQSFSIAGGRKGLAGKSGLFWEAIRVIREMREATHGKKPRFCAFENVPGILSSNRGSDYKAVLEAFAKAEIPVPRSGKWANAGMVRGGSVDVAWVIHDAQFFGVPQRRRRLFAVCDFGGQRAAEVLFKPKSLYRDFAQGGQAREGTTATASGSVGGTIHGHIYPDVVGTLCASGAGLSRPAGMGNETDLCIVTDDRSIVNNKCPMTTVYNRQQFDYFKESDIASTQTAHQAVDPVDLVHTVSCAVDCRNMREYMEMSGTLSAKEGGGYSLNYQNPIRRGGTVRRLTPTECERLQGLGDDWTAVGHDGKPLSDSARYRMLGNSVAIPCVVYVLSGIVDELLSE